MRRVKEMISALRKCAKEHENEVVSTGQIVTSSLCRDVAEYLEADRWQYPSKGELPDKDGEYLCRYYKYNLRFSRVLRYRVKDNKWYKLYYDEEYRAPKPDAWQYIIPPEEDA